ncbi:MAG: hypothetical protein QXF82_03090 [Nitrososphaeria archaeon]
MLERSEYTYRQLLGYQHELSVSACLFNYDPLLEVYSPNCLSDIHEYVKTQGLGSDFTIPQLNIELESKYSEGKIFPSWIIRDWLPRFKDKLSLHLVVHNPELKLTEESRRMLIDNHVLTIELNYLPPFLDLLKRSWTVPIGLCRIVRGNKPIEVGAYSIGVGAYDIEVNACKMDPGKGPLWKMITG